MTMTATTKKYDFGTHITFVGIVNVYTESGKFIYSHKTGIGRTSRDQALIDAMTLKNDLITRDCHH